MKRKHRFLEYLRLIRPQGAAATGAVVIIGSLIMMGQRNLPHLSILFIIGVLSHIFTFVLNEYADIRADEKSQYLKEKPLVSSAIPKNHALFIALLACVCAYALTIIFFQSLFPLLFLSLALLAGGMYNILGKKIPGSDLLIAGGCFFGCLFGASTVSIHFTNLVYIISFSIFIYIVFSNAVVGGLKDADHDDLAGAKTTATRMGVKVENGKLLIPKKFTVFAYTVKLTYIGLIVLAGFQPELSLWKSDEYMIHIIVIFLVVVIFATLYKFWRTSEFDRPRFNRLFGIHEIAAYSLAPIILLPIIGLNITLILILLPLFWLLIVNFILYGKPMQPQV
ncbi:MAG: UbiA family prenyltransferase [Thermoplasmatales archaeon]|nr:UbiA family prenyltransferase [Thermoplasmatales archaeon]